MLALLVSVAFADPAELAAALERCAVGADLPAPALTAAELARLDAGQIVRRLHHDPAHPERPSSAVGWMVTSIPRPSLWVAAEDPHTQLDPDLVEVVVEARGPDRLVWYGFWDLPFPLDDRQWIVETWNHHALAERTGGMCWEHVWELRPGHDARPRELAARGELRSLTPERVDAAMWIPWSRGGWAMIELPDGRVLAVYQNSAVVGGVIPDWAVQRGAMARLEGLMREAERRAVEWAPGHYRAGHEPLHGGDGREIPPWP